MTWQCKYLSNDVHHGEVRVIGGFDSVAVWAFRDIFTGRTNCATYSVLLIRCLSPTAKRCGKPNVPLAFMGPKVLQVFFPKCVVLNKLYNGVTKEVLASFCFHQGAGCSDKEDWVIVFFSV